MSSVISARSDADRLLADITALRAAASLAVAECTAPLGMSSSLLARSAEEPGDSDHRDLSGSTHSGSKSGFPASGTSASEGSRHGGEVLSSELAKGGFGAGPAGRSGHRFSRSEGAAERLVGPLDPNQLASSPQHGCPPHGVKAICGRRPRMEDAYTAFPFLVEVPLLPDSCPQHDIIPSRIAGQVRSAGNTPPSSDAGGSDCEADSQHRTQRSLGTPKAGGQPFMESLHFFGVFDGHGGAEAAAHCAQTLHQHIAEALSAATSPSCSDSRGAGPSDSFNSSATADRSANDAAQRSAEADEDASAAAARRRSFVSLDPPAAISHREDALRLSEHRGSGESSGSGASDTLIDAGIAKETGPPPADQQQGANVPACRPDKFEAALTAAFNLTDEEFGKGDNAALVGTTAVVALVGSRQLFVANCGDSRAVLCRGDVAMPLTDDHKAAREDETARVEALGGQILFWNGVRVMGVLAVSRAIGDHCLRPFVIAKPEVTILARRPDDELLLLASDGLWDVLSNQEACTLAKRCLRRARQRGASRQSAARIAATVLTRAAIDRGSRDNVTVVVVDLSAGEDGGSDGERPTGGDGEMLTGSGED